jgi:hypothetical protein
VIGQAPRLLLEECEYVEDGVGVVVMSASLSVVCFVVVEDWCSGNEPYRSIIDHEHVQKFIDYLHVIATHEPTEANESRGACDVMRRLI